MLNQLAEEIRSINEDNGWNLPNVWTPEQDVTQIALIGCEVSEAIEEIRKGGDVTRNSYPDGLKPEGVPAELADVIIRVLDYSYARGIDIESAVFEKLEFNTTRSHRHGGKVL